MSKSPNTADLLPPSMVDIERVLNILSGFRFRFSSERDLQDGIAKVLEQNNILYRREQNLSKRDRPDFILGDGIAVEVKIKGSLSELLRQSARYLEHQEIKQLIVVGTPSWIHRLPSTLGGKNLRGLRLVGSLL